MKASDRKDLESLTNYIFEHEFEDYVECLCETFPEDIDYINECVKNNNIASLDKYAWNGTREVPPYLRGRRPNLQEYAMLV